MSVERQVVRALGSISGATLLSRILGFVRDMVVALVFGAGPVTDAFFVAFRIPNMLRRLLAEGALSTAVVPVFSEYAETRSRDELITMLRAVLGAAILALGLTTIVGIAGAPWILRVIAPGFSDDPVQADLAVLLTRVMFPYLPLVGLAALAMGVLQIHGRFFAASIGPALLNVGMIAGVVLFARHLQPPILALAIGVLIGGGLAADDGPSGCSGGSPRPRRHAELLAAARLLRRGPGDGRAGHAANAHHPGPLRARTIHRDRHGGDGAGAALVRRRARGIFRRPHRGPGVLRDRRCLHRREARHPVRRRQRGRRADADGAARPRRPCPGVVDRRLRESGVSRDHRAPPLRRPRCPLHRLEPRAHGDRLARAGRLVCAAPSVVAASGDALSRGRLAGRSHRGWCARVLARQRRVGRLRKECAGGDVAVAPLA